MNSKDLLTDNNSMQNSNIIKLNIDEIVIDYNKKYKNEKPILFRNDNIKQILSVLIGKNKPNALLVGQNGVGKTKIVEELARQIENNEPTIPNYLKDYKIYELPLSNIIAGSSFVGELESKLNALLSFLSNPQNKAILFIDEIHQLLTSTQSYNKIAQILKPVLARGDIKVIGSTTTQEVKNLLDDPAFNRRFSRIIVEELTNEQTKIIIENLLPSFESHFNNTVKLPKTLIPNLVNISNNYSPSTNHRPDTTVTLLERVMAEKIVEHKGKAIKTSKLDTLVLTERDLLKTANTLLRGSTTDPIIDFDKLEKELKDSIKNQDDIINSVITNFRHKSLNLFESNSPIAFMFAGKSGTGKTEIAKILARELTKEKPIILNMTEYHSPSSINRIIGSPAGYVGSDSNAELPFDSLETNPYKLILLDELEKADKSVQRLFMSALEEGYVKTNKNHNIDFSKSIIIATTNAGQTSNNAIGFNQLNTKSKTIDNLKNAFDIEFLNRFKNNIYEFNNIDKNTYKEILSNVYEKTLSKIKNKKYLKKLNNKLSEDELNMLVEQSYIPEFNARPAQKTIENFIESKLI